MIVPSRLIHRLEPYKDECITGFLMRVANKNSLRSPLELLNYVTHSMSATVQYKQIPEIAFFCRNSIDELLQLSGYQKWVNSEPQWSLQSEWLTKSVFVQSRYSRVCSMCVEETPFLRSLWSISFYTHCAWHNCPLLERCPDCKRMLQWDRRLPDYCSCRHYLPTAITRLPHGNSLLLSKTIAYRLTNDSLIKINFEDQLLFERLAVLSVDGICKTIWFLGHCIPELGSHLSGHGRKKPTAVEFETMVNEAFKILIDWPDAIGKKLDHHLHQILEPEFTAVAFHYLLRPLDHYLRTSLDHPELCFIGNVYEQYLQKIWSKSGKKNTGSRYEKQLNLGF